MRECDRRSRGIAKYATLLEKHAMYRANILIIDDDISIVNIIHRMLADIGEHRYALTAEDGLVLARQAIPDLILLDASLPGMTGFDLCEVMRSDPQLHRVPIIFVTAHDAPAFEIDALRLGASGYVTKPLQSGQLRSRVKSQLRQQKWLDHRRQTTLTEGTTRAWRADSIEILVVVNGTAESDVLSRALDGMGVLTFATSGHEAISLASPLMPTLAIVSNQLSGTTGFQVCADLRRKAKFPDMPIFLMVDDAVQGDSDLEEAIDLGAADESLALSQPAVLRARVQRVLEQIRTTESELAEASRLRQAP